MPERKRLISKEDPAASAKRRQFGRHAKAEVTRRRSTKEKKVHAEQDVTRASWAELDVKIARIDGMLEELRARENQKGLSDVEAAFIGTEKTRLEGELEEARKARENQVLPGGAPEKLSAEEHQEVMASIERDMEREIAQEQNLESFLELYRAKEGGHWRNQRLVELGPVIERLFLEPGATERRLVEMYLENPEALPDVLRVEVEGGVNELIEATAAQQAAEARYTNENLREHYRKSIIQFYQDGSEDNRKKRSELVRSAMARKGHKPLADLKRPDVAIVAIREAVLAKGALAAQESGNGRRSVDFVIATLLTERKSFANDEQKSLDGFLKAEMQGSFSGKYDADRERASEMLLRLQQMREKLERAGKVFDEVDAESQVDWEQVREEAKETAVHLETERVRAEIVRRRADMKVLSEEVRRHHEKVMIAKARLEQYQEQFRDVEDWLGAEATRLWTAMEREKEAMMIGGKYFVGDVLTTRKGQADALGKGVEFDDKTEALVHERARRERREIDALHVKISDAIGPFTSGRWGDFEALREPFVERLKQKREVLDVRQRAAERELSSGVRSEGLDAESNKARVRENTVEDVASLQQDKETLQDEIVSAQEDVSGLRELRWAIEREVSPRIEAALAKAREVKKEFQAEEDAAAIQLEGAVSAWIPWGKEKKIEAARKRQNEARAAAAQAEKNIQKISARWNKMQDWSF